MTDSRATVPRLLSTQEVASRCHVSRYLIDKKADAGEIDFIQMGRIRRYREEAVDRFLEKLTVKAKH